MTLTHRRATRNDIARLQMLLAAATGQPHELFLDPGEAGASRAVMGPDSQLIDDGTSYVVEVDGVIAGFGAWSRRVARRHGDRQSSRGDDLLDPRSEAARVAAMHIHPHHDGSDVGRRILEACTRDAAAEGYRRLELLATPAGIPLGEESGFEAAEEAADDTNGVSSPLTRMTRRTRSIVAERGGQADPGLLKPRSLQPGDAIGVLSLGWGGPSIFPEVFEAGVQTLRRLGCEVVELATARRTSEVLRRDPRGRAEDLNAAFADPNIAGIVTSIGGDDSARILPYLDAEVIRSNRKVLMGYSDTTAQLVFAHQLGLVTYHGPTVMAGLAQALWFPELEAHMRAILFDSSSPYEYRPFAHWVDGYVDWSTTQDPTAVGDLEATDGWHWVNDGCPRPGRLVGGCFEVMEFLKGTPWWPDPNWWDDRILFLETSEGVPTPEQVRFWLFNYGLQGLFQRLNGLLIGRPRGYDAEETRQLDEVVRTVVVDEFGAGHLPIVTNMDFGHTDPQWILPIGCTAEIDPERQSFRLTEPAVLAQ